MPPHPRSDQAEATPGVEQRVDQDELGLVALYAHGGERSDEEGAAVITWHRARSPASRTPTTT